MKIKIPVIIVVGLLLIYFAFYPEGLLLLVIAGQF